MPRLYIPDITEDIINELSTLESALEWLKRLEQAQERLEEELQQIKMVLKFVVKPRYNRLMQEKYRQENIPNG